MGQPFALNAWPDVPTRVLAGRDDRLFPVDFQRRVARERLGIEADVIDGGHMVALGHPRELAERPRALSPGGDQLPEPRRRSGRVGSARGTGPV